MTGLIPVAIDRPIKVPVDVVAIAPVPEHPAAVADAGRLKAVREATGLGRLHEGHSRDRRSHYRAKNKPHEDTSSAGYSRDNTRMETGNLTRSYECRRSVHY